MAAVPNTFTEMHQRILDNINTAVMLFKADLTLIYANPAAEMLLGASMHRLVGLNFDDLISAKEPIKEQVANAVKTTHPFSRHEQAISLMREKEVTVDFTVNILLSAFTEKEILFEMFPIDRLRRILRDDAILSQQDTTQDLLRGLAHEIKNPLSGLRGAAQLLERELHSEDQKEYTRVIIDEADRLQKLVNRLLGPSGMPNFIELNIHEVLEYVVNIAFQNKVGINFSRDYDPSIPTIVGDQDLLIQAILNIVNNAVEEVKENGNINIKTRVLRNFTIGEKTYRLVIKLDVIDDGDGVSEDIKDKIFFPMITGRAEGTGLGLSIAQRLVHQHAGLIECESEPGKTIFSVFLPITNENGEG